MTDVVVRLAEPLNPASDTTSAISIHGGGSGANLATWLAYAGGLEVHLIGRVGQDAFGAFQIAELKRAGVIPHIGQGVNLATGSLVVLVDPDQSHERHMLTDRGANRSLQIGDLPQDLFQPGNRFHLSGYSLLEPGLTRDTALAALKLAHERRMFTSVDPSSAAMLTRLGPARFLEWTQGMTLCFPNLDEGRVLTGETEPSAIVEKLAHFYDEVVLKLGAAGAIWRRGVRPFETLSRPAAVVKVVDTTGAGDAFCAGFLASRIQNATPEAALQMALHFGTLATTRPGGRPA